jgi:hypothetical protein
MGLGDEAGRRLAEVLGHPCRLAGQHGNAAQPDQGGDQVKVIMPNQSKALAAPRRRRRRRRRPAGRAAPAPAAAWPAWANRRKQQQRPDAVAADIRKFCASSGLRRSSQSAQSASGSTGQAGPGQHFQVIEAEAAAKPRLASSAVHHRSNSVGACCQSSRARAGPAPGRCPGRQPGLEAVAAAPAGMQHQGQRGGQFDGGDVAAGGEETDAEAGAEDGAAAQRPAAARWRGRAA